MPSSELSVMFSYVYLLHSLKNGQLYVGFTNDLKKRVTEHNKGQNRSTRPYTPWELIYYESHRSEKDARRREKYFKTSAGKSSLKRMLREQLTAMNDLSQQKVYF